MSIVAYKNSAERSFFERYDLCSVKAYGAKEGVLRLSPNIDHAFRRSLYTVCSMKAYGTKEGVFRLPPNMQYIGYNNTLYT